MSLIHLKRLLTSAVLVLVMASQTLAVQGFRPWAPYQYDEFGGGYRAAEGMHGSIGLINLTFASTKDIIVGATNPDGSSATRPVYTGSNSILQGNTINTSQLDSLTGTGTYAEFGRQVGHFGWHIGGYSLSGASASSTSTNSTMVINDLANYYVEPHWDTNAAYDAFWSGMGSPFMVVNPPNATYPQEVPGVGYLWGWYVTEWSPTFYSGRIAPMPINFESTKVSTKLEHWSVEAVGTYRLHPYMKDAGLEIFGGVRYMEVDDSLRFTGEGLPWKGIEYDAETDAFTGTATGYGSILGGSDWKFKAENHVVAPLIGARFVRQNKRWTLTAEGKFLAGLNSQNLSSNGHLGNWYERIDEIDFGTLNPSTVENRGIYPWTPVGLSNSNRAFNHKKTRHEFSPGVEAKVNANWQITNAVGIQFGVTAMWMDKVAKGAYINDYTIDQNGTIFGIKSNKSSYLDDVLAYGFQIGFTVNRFK